MTKYYEIIHTCGHTTGHNFFGNESAHTALITWYEKSLCRDCEQAEQHMSLEVWTTSRNLKALEGTEKQVAWANKIRKDIIVKVERQLSTDVSQGNVEMQAYGQRVLKLLRMQGKAKFWIDRNMNSAQAIIREMVAVCKNNDAQAVAK